MKITAIIVVVCVTWSAIQAELIHTVLRRSMGMDKLKAVMMDFGDSDDDRELTGEEIENFFTYFINLSESNALRTAQQFIKDADINENGSLDEEELSRALRHYAFGNQL
ncbi:uncharacterized protein LOC125681853 [Ostrea edulis]|uniref:uncharacterized protein LOC125681853 n=1 Tax=Ostrea edulis TaxID=37623 RepID=UPI0020947CCE|nr:uncharacterized protein LOC125681853 [Ostrea edulis]